MNFKFINNFVYGAQVAMESEHQIASTKHCSHVQHSFIVS